MLRDVIFLVRQGKFEIHGSLLLQCFLKNVSCAHDRAHSDTNFLKVWSTNPISPALLNCSRRAVPNDRETWQPWTELYFDEWLDAFFHRTAPPPSCLWTSTSANSITSSMAWSARRIAKSPCLESKPRFTKPCAPLRTRRSYFLKIWTRTFVGRSPCSWPLCGIARPSSSRTQALLRLLHSSWNVTADERILWTQTWNLYVQRWEVFFDTIKLAS